MERNVEATAMMNAPNKAARMVLRSSPALVLGDADPDALPGERTFRTTVAAQLGPGTTMEQAVTITLGSIHSSNSEGRISASFSWDPVGFERLLPSFTGELVLDECEGAGRSRLTLSGSYRAPMGAVGRFGDSVVGHRLARRSLTLYVERLAERLEQEAIRRDFTGLATPAPYNDDLRPDSRSEHHIG